MFSSERLLTQTFKSPESRSFLSRLLADHLEPSKNKAASWLVVANLILVEASNIQRSRSVKRSPWRGFPRIVRRVLSAIANVHMSTSRKYRRVLYAHPTDLAFDIRRHSAANYAARKEKSVKHISTLSAFPSAGETYVPTTPRAWKRIARN